MRCGFFHKYEQDTGGGCFGNNCCPYAQYLPGQIRKPPRLGFYSTSIGLTDHPCRLGNFACISDGEAGSGYPTATEIVTEVSTDFFTQIVTHVSTAYVTETETESTTFFQTIVQTHHETNVQPQTQIRKLRISRPSFKASLFSRYWLVLQQIMPGKLLRRRSQCLLYPLPLLPGRVLGIRVGSLYIVTTRATTLERSLAVLSVVWRCLPL
jgi:hypothetical protein